MLKQRLSLLTGLLLLAVAAHGGLFWFQNHFQQRDFSPIADPVARAGYCMAASLAANEKIDLADSLVRSPDRALFARVMSLALSGEVTAEKLAASRALLERDELRARSARAVARVAEKCGWHRLRQIPGGAPQDLVLRWLQNDATFLAMLAQARQRPPDAAERFAQQREPALRVAN
jgi:hypothetical protein